MSSSNLIPAKEPAERLGLSVWALYSYVRQGQVPCVRFGRAIRFSPESLDEFIRNGGVVNAEKAMAAERVQ